MIKVESIFLRYDTGVKMFTKEYMLFDNRTAKAVIYLTIAALMAIA